MSDFKEESIIANMVVRISVLENILISNNLTTKEEIDKMQHDYTVSLAKSLLGKSGVKLSDEKIEELLSKEDIK